MLRFADSFDHYSVLTDKWTASRNVGGTTNTTVPRFGPRGFHINESWVRKLLDDQDTWILGVACFGVNGLDESIFACFDGAQNQVDVRLNTVTGTVYATRNGTLLGSALVPGYTNSKWLFYEAAFVIDNAAGAVEVHVEGDPLIVLTGIDTQVSANPSANTLWLGSLTGGFSPGHFDDFYACDGQASAVGADTFLGDVRVQNRMPNGNGNSSDFVGSDADSTDNWQLVDEVPANGDTDYVESPTVGDEDTYEYEDLTSASGTVYGVQPLPWARKTDAGVRKIASVARLGATEEDSADKTLSVSYAYLPDVRELDPDGNQWTIANVNAAEFGPKVTA